MLEFFYYTFLISTIIQVIFYAFVFVFQFYNSRTNPRESTLPISVILYSKNNLTDLKKNLEFYLNQNYPKFELVIINDRSTDKTKEFLSNLSPKLPIKIVTITETNHDWANKKYAITLGIKAASFDHIVFTEVICKPFGKNWIQEMTADFSNKTSIIIGFSTFEKQKTMFNRLLRYDKFFDAFNYFSMNYLGMPYAGSGWNMSFAKNQFLHSKGFINHIKLDVGYDVLFINENASFFNTTVNFKKEAMTLAPAYKSFSEWYKDKTKQRYCTKFYKLKHKIILSLYGGNIVLFWLSGILLLSNLFFWHTVVSLFIIKFTLHYLMNFLSPNKIIERDVFWLSPILEPVLLLIRLNMWLDNLSNKSPY